MRSRFWGIVLLYLSLAPSQSEAVTRAFEVVSPFHPTESSIRTENGFSFLPSFDQALGANPGEPSIVWIPIAVPWIGAADSISVSLEVIEADTITLSTPLAPAQRDLITSDTASNPEWVAPSLAIYGSDAWFPESSVHTTGAGTLAGHHMLTALWAPLRYHPLTLCLIVIKRATITISDFGFGSPSEIPAETTLVDDEILDAVVSVFETASPASLSPAYGGQPSWVLSAGVPLGVEYVVITPSAFVNAVKPLVLWKARKGVSAGIAKLEDVVAAYPAVDAAESVRNYLKAAYATGLKWVVIGGDETIAPRRLSYAEFPDYDSDPHKLQNCDLYFAELNGNWDADGDGIWGEFFGDQAQMQPELYVGRLPYSTVAEAQTIVSKIMAYERGPSQAGYLTRSLSVSTDQFRDWNTGAGQHGAVAPFMPAGWTHDLSTMIEAPTGADPAPSYPDGVTFQSKLQEGFGWVNYFAHGRVDAFVVRSSGLNLVPRVEVASNGSGGDGNGYLNLVAATPTPGIHLSAACDQGGYDLNSAPYSTSAGESIAEKLLLMPSGGAAAFVGQSRWGWVSTSFKLIQKFYEYLGNSSTPNHVGVYQTLAKLSYSSFRDLTYGNNLYGDPEMPVWKTAPLSLSVVAPEVFTPGTHDWTLRAVASSAGVSGVVMTLSVGDSVWMLGQTGSDGNLSGTVTLPYATAVILTANKSGYRIWADTLPISIIADVFDDRDVMPKSFLTVSNYPNPFNAGTVIAISVPADGEVAIELFDVLGRRVHSIQNGLLAAGEHRVAFDGTDESGQPLASGVYFARARVLGQVVTRKLVVLR